MSAMAARTTSAVHPRPRLAPSAVGLLDSARDGLRDASHAATPASRYAAAHLAALRGAAAVLATFARPSGPPRKRPRSVWALLPAVAPALQEWAAFFEAGARKRAAAEAGLPRAVTQREADDLLRDADTFVALVCDTLGVAQPSVSDSTARLASGSSTPQPMSSSVSALGDFS